MMRQSSLGPLEPHHLIHDGERLELRVACPTCTWGAGHDPGVDCTRVLQARPINAAGEEEGPWVPLSPRALLYRPAGTAVWVWLRSQGVRRPSPSGPSGRRMSPRSPRAPHVDWTPGAASLALLDALCRVWGCSRPEALRRAVAGAGEQAGSGVYLGPP
jgi:hypothetical protein